MSTLVFRNSVFLLLSILKKRVIHPWTKIMKTKICLYILRKYEYTHGIQSNTFENNCVYICILALEDNLFIFKSGERKSFAIWMLVRLCSF